MGTWSIVEGDGASITQDGKVKIPSSSTYKEYKVSYKSNDDGCTCYHTITQSAAPPVGCTFTVRSNVEGATVVWQDWEETTIVDGKSSRTDSVKNSMLVRSIEKDGCTFYPRGGNISCNGTLQLNGDCGGGGCSSYNYTYASTANIGCEGGTSVELAYTATCVDDASDWYTGKTTAIISEIGCNSSTSTQTYTRTWNGHSITITQDKGDCCSTPGCTCSLDLDDDLSENGGSHVKVGTWSSTCSGTHGIKYVNGDDFLSSFDLSSNGNVYATFSANAGGEKTATYALTGTGCYDNASAGQKGSGGGGGCDCSLAESSASFTSAGGSKSITVNGASSCSGWQATSSKSWCTPDYRSGELTITVGEYTDTTTDRSATVTLKADSGSKTCGTVSVTQSKKSGSCTINYTSTGKTGHASFSYGGSTKTSSSGSFTASGTGGTITASADSEYYVQPSSNDVPCGGSKRFDIFKNVSCTVYGGNTGTSVSIDYHPSSAPSATVAFSIDYDYNGTKYTHTEYGKTVSAAGSGKNSFTVTLPRGTAINNTLKIVSKSFTNSLDYNKWEHYTW